MSRSISYISQYAMRPLPRGKLVGGHGGRDEDFPRVRWCRVRKGRGCYIRTESGENGEGREREEKTEILVNKISRIS